MTHYHAVLLDECGEEFGAGVEAPDRATAYDLLKDMYPESRSVVQLESPQDTRDREAAIYAQMDAAYNGEFFYDGEDY